MDAPVASRRSGSVRDAAGGACRWIVTLTRHVKPPTRTQSRNLSSGLAAYLGSGSVFWSVHRLQRLVQKLYESFSNLTIATSLGPRLAWSPTILWRHGSKRLPRGDGLLRWRAFGPTWTLTFESEHSDWSLCDNSMVLDGWASLDAVERSLEFSRSVRKMELSASYLTTDLPTNFAGHHRWERHLLDLLTCMSEPWTSSMVSISWDGKASRLCSVLACACGRIMWCVKSFETISSNMVKQRKPPPSNCCGLVSWCYPCVGLGVFVFCQGCRRTRYDWVSCWTALSRDSGDTSPHFALRQLLKQRRHSRQSLQVVAGPCYQSVHGPTTLHLRAPNSMARGRRTREQSESIRTHECGRVVDRVQPRSDSLPWKRSGDCASSLCK